MSNMINKVPCINLLWYLTQVIFLLSVPLWWLADKWKEWSHLVFVQCEKLFSLWLKKSKNNVPFDLVWPDQGSKKNEWTSGCGQHENEVNCSESMREKFEKFWEVFEGLIRLVFKRRNLSCGPAKWVNKALFSSRNSLRVCDLSRFLAETVAVFAR